MEGDNRSYPAPTADAASTTMTSPSDPQTLETGIGVGTDKCHSDERKSTSTSASASTPAPAPAPDPPKRTEELPAVSTPIHSKEHDQDGGDQYHSDPLSPFVFSGRMFRFDPDKIPQRATRQPLSGPPIQYSSPAEDLEVRQKGHRQGDETVNHTPQNKRKHASSSPEPKFGPSRSSPYRPELSSITTATPLTKTHRPATQSHHTHQNQPGVASGPDKDPSMITSVNREQAGGDDDEQEGDRPGTQSNPIVLE